ncbi:hypothetical protein ES705_47368 [subsurface metagenome]
MILSKVLLKFNPFSSSFINFTAKESALKESIVQSNSEKRERTFFTKADFPKPASPLTITTFSLVTTS